MLFFRHFLRTSYSNYDYQAYAVVTSENKLFTKVVSEVYLSGDRQQLPFGCWFLWKNYGHAVGVKSRTKWLPVAAVFPPSTTRFSLFPAPGKPAVQDVYIYFANCNLRPSGAKPSNNLCCNCASLVLATDFAFWIVKWKWRNWCAPLHWARFLSLAGAQLRGAGIVIVYQVYFPRSSISSIFPSGGISMRLLENSILLLQTTWKVKCCNPLLFCAFPHPFWVFFSFGEIGSAQ